MAKKIGIFRNEQQVINAVAELEQAGFVASEMKILAKDSEHSRRIERETDAHADEIRELDETNQHTDGAGPIGFAASAGYGFPMAAMNNGSYGAPGYVTAGAGLNGGFAFAAPLAFTAHHDHEDAFRALGLDSKETELCSQAIREGSIALVVDTSESKSLLDKDGGPDLSKLGIAEAAFRRCGAQRIADGG
ncbi:general stress protein [Paenibacillus sp. PL2-23]|uniref:general stress protein n=1 Tax=Paenibacillus sp. PL2-23 TaxID=2100729 RepID=UPI0030F7898B